MFTEVNIWKDWYQVDPEMLRIHIHKSYKNFEIYAEGLDSEDLGLNSYRKLREAFLLYKENYLKKKNKSNEG